jgi:hypothetical protein
MDSNLAPRQVAVNHPTRPSPPTSCDRKVRGLRYEKRWPGTSKRRRDAGALVDTHDFGVVSNKWQIRGTGEFELG